jgi:hypothetical protein
MGKVTGKGIWGRGETFKAINPVALEVFHSPYFHMKVKDKALSSTTPTGLHSPMSSRRGPGGRLSKKIVPYAPEFF